MKKYFYEVYEQTNEEKDEWELRSSHMTEELASQWIVELIQDNPDYEDINFRNLFKICLTDININLIIRNCHFLKQV